MSRIDRARAGNFSLQSLSVLLEGRSAELADQIAALDGLRRSLDDGAVPDAGALAPAVRRGAYGWLLGGDPLEAQLEAALDLAGSLPAPAAGRARPALSTRIGIVADKFFYQSFDGLADLVELTPDNFREHLDVDLLLVVSTWKGLDGESWKGLASEGSKKRQLLLEELVPAYRKAGIPVVFYSKEDPPNYGRFLEIARHADIVFTSAEEKLPDYRRDCPDASHYGVLPFGVNPLHHSPIGSRPGQSDLVYFAGSWLPVKYPSRTKHGTMLLEGVLEAGRKLCLIDRYSAMKGKDPRYAFPDRFKPFTAGARDHADLMRLQRISDIAINLNSVVDSQTMFANRNLELQASGTVVLSNYNMGLNSNYPQIHLANSTADVKGALEALSFEEMRRIQADGIRKVFTDDHALHRLDTILEAAGIAAPDRRITAVAVAEDPTDALRAAMAAQTHGPVEVLTPEQYAAGAAADIVLPLSPEYVYGVDYVADHAAAFCYTDADATAKHTGTLREADAHSHRFLDEVPDPYAAAWWQGGSAAPVPAVAALPGAAAEAAEAPGRVYGIDAFGVRRSGATGHVNLDVPAAPRADPATLELAVVVPIYNNGDHLRHKAFASLLRCSVFGKMHVILVDDGSTDGTTLETVDELVARYGNVSSFKFPAGGSGSASRPRNKGLELADTEFVTYLDPDDEMIEDGYAVLLKRLAETDADFVVGDMIRWHSGRQRIRNVQRLRVSIPERDGILYPERTSLEEMSYIPVSIEAIAARTAWLKSLGLEQPVGALGQDTFFFQQMVYYARQIAYVRQPVYAYYSAVSSSVVNVVSPRFFRKYLPLEQARTAWLREVDLLESYRHTRHEHNFKGWYLKKLGSVAEEHYDEAAGLVEEIARLFGEHDWKDPEVLEFWERQAVRSRSAQSPEPASGD